MQARFGECPWCVVRDCLYTREDRDRAAAAAAPAVPPAPVLPAVTIPRE